MRFTLSFWLMAATIAGAQVAPLQAHTPGAKPSNAVSEQPSTVVPPKPLSLLDEAAHPAQVQLDDGKLSIKADNSTLSGILNEISSKTGMKVDGLSGDQRIFGNYGPGTPREVVASLLDGLSYNVVMVGSLHNGAPREVILTPRTGGLPTNSPAMVARQVQQDDNAENGDNSVDDNNPPETPDTSPLPPRPVNSPELNAAPEQQQQQPEQPNNGVKTPQQLLQELQEMRARQMQQQNPQ
jgi:hypothetical protein